MQARIFAPHVAVDGRSVIVSTRQQQHRCFSNSKRCRVVAVKAADKPAPRGSSGGGRKPRRRSRRRIQPPLEPVERPWPVELPDGTAELQAAMELMAALGPGEVALMAQGMRDAARARLAAELAGSGSGSGQTGANADDGQQQQQGGEEEDGAPFEWDADTLQAHMWGTLRARLGAADVSILDKAFGRNWGAIGALEPAALEAALDQLTPHERGRLEGVLDRLRAFMGMFGEAEDLGAEADAWAAAASGAGSSGSGGDADGSGRGAGPYPGASPAMRAAIDAAAGRGGVLGDVDFEQQQQQQQQRQQDGASGSGSGSSTQQQEGGWDAAAGGGLDASVNSVLRHARAIQEGVQDWGPEPSRHFRVLKTIHARLTELDAMDLDNLEAKHGFTPDDYEAAFEYVAEQLAALTDNADAIDDAATRSALLWMDAALADADTGELVMDAEKLAALGTFLAAAENLQKLKVWALAFAEGHPNLQLERLVAAAGLDGDDWFVARDARAAAANAVEAAAAVGAPLGPALLPHVDAARIEWLAALDGDTLCFTADLQRRGYSADALIKWSLHPTVGPRLASGEWYDAANLPDVIAALAREAREPMPGVDFTFNFRTPAG